MDDVATILEQGRPWVEIVARGCIRRGAPAHMFDDLMQEGRIGLLKAVSRYDPTRGTKLRTFAGSFIYGAMADWLRRQDFVPRVRRRRAKANGTLTPMFHSLEVGMRGNAEGKEVEHATNLADTRPQAAEIIAGEDELERMLRCLPRDMKLVMRWVADGLTQKEVAGALGLSESRVAQMRRQAVEILRANVSIETHKEDCHV